MNIELLKETLDNYNKLTALLIEKNLSISAMESCTSGLIATLITNIDNSSKVFNCGAVTYSNTAKINQGVSENIINKYGVYSYETSIEMARAIKEKANSNISIGITGSLGIADPKNLDSKPGEVYYTIDYLEPKSYFIEVSNQGSKFSNKLYTANIVCLELLKQLEQK